MRSRDHTLVIVLASCQRGPNSLSAQCPMWVDFVVGSFLPLRAFLHVIQFSSLHKNQLSKCKFYKFDQDRAKRTCMETMQPMWFLSKYWSLFSQVRLKSFLSWKGLVILLTKESRVPLLSKRIKSLIQLNSEIDFGLSFIYLILLISLNTHLKIRSWNKMKSCHWKSPH